MRKTTRPSTNGWAPSVAVSSRPARPTLLTSALHLAFGSVVTFAAGHVAFAQESPEVPKDLGKVIVTGSNIPRSDKETASPLQVITAEDMKKSGYTTVSEVLRDITANGQGTLSQSFNQAFAAGGSGISLRGLTVGATLVLIDGYRMAPYPLSDDGERPFVDISSIPFSAVDHIEILKDGASAVYGSDAIAGVVNVILKKGIQGTSVSADLGTSQHGGGATKSAAISHGFGDAGSPVNGFLALDYRHQNQILLDQRSGPWTNFDFTSYGGEDLRPGSRNDIVSTPRVKTPYLQRPGGAGSDPTAFAFYPGCTYTQMRASQCQYQNTWAQLQPTTENINLLGRLNANFSDNWSGSVTASYFDSKSQQVGSQASIPFGSFAGITAIGPGQTPSIQSIIPNFTVPANYPGNTLGVPANIRAFLPDRSSRADNVDSKSTRLVAEVDGDVSGWLMRGAVGYTKVETDQRYSGYIDYQNLYTALNDPTNPFMLTGGNSAAVMSAVSPNVSNKTTDVLTFAEAHVSRELMQLNGGALGFATGITYVHKDLNAPDPVEAQRGEVPVSGSYAQGKENNTSIYGELRAPVLKTLELDAAIRHDHYDTYGNSTTPKAGFKFVPTKEFSLRGTYSRGFRAPSPTENGTAGSLFGFNQIRDPILCPTSDANGAPVLTAPTNIPAECALSPTYLQTTSKSLQPEKSKSYTFGIILEPIQDWATTFDYYKITVSNQIVSAASLASFDPLAFAVRATPQISTFGDGSTGLSSAGPIQYIATPYVNAQETVTSGVEFESHYRFKLPDTSGLTVGFQLTHTLRYDLTLNGTTAQLAGTHGPAIISGDTGNPRDRAQLTLGYDKGPFSISTTTNYVGRYGVTDPSNGINSCADALINKGYNSQFVNLDTPPAQFCKIPSFTYTNLTTRYVVMKGFSVHATISNLFDRQPPVDLATYGGTGANGSSNGGGAPYNPSLHQIGAVGRFFSLGADYNF